MIRIAAVGDLHVDHGAAGRIRDGFDDIGRRADVLLLAGDLTQHGTEEEGAILAAELADIPIPIVAVLGNHDYHQGKQHVIRGHLEAVGVAVLEGEGIVLRAGDVRIGVAGAKGFGGGFSGACGTEFGEEEMKAFIRHTKTIAERLRDALVALEADVRVALLHYAPTRETLTGERLEIYPFLGSYLLGEAIDQAGCNLALHGHAHLGTERGTTPGGTPVRNVARPVIKRSYRLYCLHEPGEVLSEAC